MLRRTSTNIISDIESYYNKILKHCNTLRSLIQLHSVLTTTGLIKQSVHLGAKIIINYSSFKHIEHARFIFNTHDHVSSSFLWNTMLRGFKNWEQVGKLRQDMKNKGLRKPAALSFVEFNNELHGFHTGEQLDSFTRDVYQKVEQMVTKLKTAGHVPDLSCVFHDVEEEDKDGMLIYHGEKLALAFGLMNIDPELPIRITKNLRVCTDCHSTFKLVSRVYGRKVIVRDVNRFHHFEDGLCSCNDYW
ncbi:Pentatricopeptide repeat-containing protein [Artemisia annua]|uniref:Pentatricopeptide repeat-containing protein n=1 Tax=Artemisia annua TaxID=35608 RepID=A0A2U1LJ23_ARTAN|nr:Pentatricopeptide repeat-containing protein [Artemisia annua]